jgi:hypothetical protein
MVAGANVSAPPNAILLQRQAVDPLGGAEWSIHDLFDPYPWYFAGLNFLINPPL